MFACLHVCISSKDKIFLLCIFKFLKTNKRKKNVFKKLNNFFSWIFKLRWELKWKPSLLLWLMSNTYSCMINYPFSNKNLIIGNLTLLDHDMPFCHYDIMKLKHSIMTWNYDKSAWSITILHIISNNRVNAMTKPCDNTDYCVSMQIMGQQSFLHYSMHYDWRRTKYIRRLSHNFIFCIFITRNNCDILGQVLPAHMTLWLLASV